VDVASVKAATKAAFVIFTVSPRVVNDSQTRKTIAVTFL